MFTLTLFLFAFFYSLFLNISISVASSFSRFRIDIYSCYRTFSCSLSFLLVLLFDLALLSGPPLYVRGEMREHQFYRVWYTEHDKCVKQRKKNIQHFDHITNSNLNYYSEACERAKECCVSPIRMCTEFVCTMYVHTYICHFFSLVFLFALALFLPLCTRLTCFM